MAQLRCLQAILLGLMVFVQAESNTTRSPDERVSSNGTLLPVRPLLRQRGGVNKTVLIVAYSNNTGLRTEKITSLRYEEFDTDNKLLNQYSMYDMEGVKVFFEEFLGTEVCYKKCE